ncbi:MAG TPA: PKD domain-containing protein, partial [Candidatus Portnoybacteria bacterium]|nr:PKD domain-containing protein [Candidatus Portnoybacteria bacterium]
EKVKLYSPNNKLIDEIIYSSTKEGKSYSYNFQNKKWLWSQFLTPNKQNKFNHPPSFKVDFPKEVYTGEETLFKATEFDDKDGDNLQIKCDFGDGRIIVGNNIKYLYQKEGKYTVTITVSDGLVEVVKKQELKVILKPLSKIILTKLMPNPQGADSGREKISIKNIGSEAVNLKNYQIATGSSLEKVIKHKITQDFILQPQKEAIITNEKICKFILTNTSGAVRLLMPDGRIIDEVQYQKDNIADNQEYILQSNRQWNWIQTIQEKEMSNKHLPNFQIKKPKKVYKNIYAEFSLGKLRDEDGDKLKVVWDFGDGHRSYLKKTKHRYKKTGKYLVTIKVKDGQGKRIEQFKIKVKKYPKYKLRIVGLLPNPAGKDRGKEFIAIKNNSKRKINLQNYKIITGSNKKKLTGHPFYKKFIIKAGETKRLFNGMINKFNLLNKAGLVQILYPNGKVADELRYGKNKILENEQYIFTNSQRWQWLGGNNSGRKTSFNFKNSSVKVLGQKITRKNIDITLDQDNKICQTIQQIKIGNWKMNN